MNKLLSLVVFVILFGIVGYSTFRLLDSDKKFQLPFSQNVVSTQKKTVLGSTNLNISHIVIIVMENKSSRDIIGNPDAPFINSLAQAYSMADNYFAVSHPSLPNYIALLGGDTYGITSDCTDCFISSVNLVDQLEKAHKSWKAYMEGMPASCFVGSSGNYAQKHNPFIYFDDIRNSAKCQKIVPFSFLQQDLESQDSLPNFVWITPNLCHDMHNCSVSVGDTWLATEVPLLLNSPAFTKEKSLLVITWDEGENSADNNKIPTLFVGNTVKRGYVSHNLYSHYSLMHTVEDMWNLPPLTTHVSQSAVISDIFATP